MIKSLKKDDVVQFSYTNHKNITEIRCMIFTALQFGYNEYHTKPQWFLHGYCIDRKSVRSFALKNIDITTMEIIS